MLDCIVAACSQMGDLGRAFETFEAYPALGLKPDAQAYNAVIMGCINYGLTASVPKARPPLAAFVAAGTEITGFSGLHIFFATGNSGGT
jgi:hypothetical protein